MKLGWVVLGPHGMETGPLGDTMLASYVVEAGINGHGMDELSQKHLGHKPIQFGEVAGQGKSFVCFAPVAIDKAAAYSAAECDVTLRLWNGLARRSPSEPASRAYGS